MSFFSGFMVQNPTAQNVNIDTSALASAMDSINKQNALRAQQDQAAFELKARLAAAQANNQQTVQQTQGMSDAERADLLLRQLSMVQGLQKNEMANQPAASQAAAPQSYAGYLELQSKLLDNQLKQNNVKKSNSAASYADWRQANPDAPVDEQLRQAKLLGDMDTAKSLTADAKLGSASANVIGHATSAISSLVDLNNILQSPEFANMSLPERVMYNTMSKILPVEYQTEGMKKYSMAKFNASQAMLRLKTGATISDREYADQENLMPSLLNDPDTNNYSLDSLKQYVTTVAEKASGKKVGDLLPKADDKAASKPSMPVGNKYNEWF